MEEALPATRAIPRSSTKPFKGAPAFVSIFALRGNWRVPVPLVWLANSWGFVDLLNGLRGVLQLNEQSFNLGTFWYIYTFYEPLFTLHVTSFQSARRRSWASTRCGASPLGRRTPLGVPEYNSLPGLLRR
jgi:hypothetical protein